MGEFPNKPTQFQPGQSGNPAGSKKGTRHVSTIIKRLMESEIDWDKIDIADVRKLKKRYHNNSAWEAVIYVAFTKAIQGDVKAMDWLSKTGYGDKKVHEFENPIEEILRQYGLGDDKNDRQTEETAERPPADTA